MHTSCAIRPLASKNDLEATYVLLHQELVRVLGIDVTLLGFPKLGTQPVFFF